MRSAYRSKIKQLIGDEKAKKFDALYERRSNFLHDGSGRGTLDDAADAALEIGLELLLADIAQSAAPSEGESGQLTRDFSNARSSYQSKSRWLCF